MVSSTRLLYPHYVSSAQFLFSFSSCTCACKLVSSIHKDLLSNRSGSCCLFRCGSQNTQPAHEGTRSRRSRAVSSPDLPGKCFCSQCFSCPCKSTERRLKFKRKQRVSAHRKHRTALSAWSKARRRCEMLHWLLTKGKPPTGRDPPRPSQQIRVGRL